MRRYSSIEVRPFIDKVAQNFLIKMNIFAAQGGGVFREAIDRRLIMVGEKVTFCPQGRDAEEGTRVSGTLSGANEYGHLLLAKSDVKLETFMSGELVPNSYAG